MKIKAAILGSTGVIGQHYLSLLNNHPWFEIADAEASTLIFSALPNEVAEQHESPHLKKGSTVISSASCNRIKAPLIIPEINAHHISGESRLIAKPNCALQSFLIPL